MGKELTKQDRMDWNFHMGRIQRNRDNLIEVAESITAIKNRQLWREAYKTWDAFVDEAFDVGPRRVRQIIAGGKLLARLPDKVSLGGQKPRKRQSGSADAEPAHVTNERVTRELGRLPQDEDHVEVLQEAERTSGKQRPPTAAVRAAVDKKLGIERIKCPTCLGKGWIVDDPKDSPFEKWWKFYPRRVGVDAAKKAHQKAVARLCKAGRSRPDAMGHLLERCTAYADAVSRWPADERQYVPHPSTWLNQGRFEDDPSEWVRGSGPSADRQAEASRRQSEKQRKQTEESIRTAATPAEKAQIREEFKAKQKAHA